MVMFHYRRVVIILEIDVIKSAKDVAGRIGDPVPYVDGKASKHLLYIKHSCCYLLYEKLMFILKQCWVYKVRLIFRSALVIHDS